ncbi:MAG: hypothetical protein RMK18_11600 [Armatimonadota bacterium]|nr:hypothetical protein [Armatimonadota bacterium]MCX7777918.1 hypothetical protein [Armatimonadota bacterium]MDW8026490.1 hypothetical protein [Armatimonadota bacterium]
MRLFKSILLLALLLYSCQGSSRHTVETGEPGSLEGLRFIPSDHSRYVDIDTDPQIFWLHGYKPPSRFTVSLKRIDEHGDFCSVNTKLESSGTNHWRLNVFGMLNEGTIYAIIVRDDTSGEQMEAWFMTAKSRAGQIRASEPATQDAFEHTVTR